MLVVYVVLLACIVFAHILIYWLIKAGIEDSKKPAPLSARQRRFVAGSSCKAKLARFLQNSEATGLQCLSEASCSCAEDLQRRGLACSKIQCSGSGGLLCGFLYEQVDPSTSARLPIGMFDPRWFLFFWLPAYDRAHSWCACSADLGQVL